MRGRHRRARPRDVGGGAVTEEQMESLAEIVSMCLNYAEYGTKSTSPVFASSLSPEMRIDALSNGLADVHSLARALYIELGGDDAWAATS